MKLAWANRITIARILFIVPFVICMLKINDPDPDFGRLMRYSALGIFLAMAASDVLDGYLARVGVRVCCLLRAGLPWMVSNCRQRLWC